MTTCNLTYSFSRSSVLHSQELQEKRYHLQHTLTWIIDFCESWFWILISMCTGINTRALSPLISGYYSLNLSL